MASLRGPGLAVRGLAQRLPQLATCRQCLRQQGFITRSLSNTGKPSPLSPGRTAPNAYLASARMRSRILFQLRAASTTTAASAAADAATSKSGFPDVSSKSVAYWLLASAASVFGIVVFGGLTRLTESGYVSAWSSLGRARYD